MGTTDKEPTLTQNPRGSQGLGVAGVRAWQRFGVFCFLLAAAFAVPLSKWAGFAMKSETFSYVLLIPVISGYLAWLRRPDLWERVGPPSWYAIVPGVAGLGLLGGKAWLTSGACSLNDYLSWTILALVCFLWMGGFLLLGWQGMKEVCFPMVLLACMAPIPDAVTHGVQDFLKMASSEPAAWFLWLSRIEFLREGTMFYLPGITIEVAEECSGIRSTLVLLLTALLTAQLLLRRPWARVFLVIFSVPLGIVRNGFRVAVISWLCVKISPSMIHSPIHHQGGPVFFVLSLIPLFYVTHLLRKREGPAPQPKPE